MDLLKKYAQLRSQNKSFALCTIVETSGSTPRKVGCKFLVQENQSNVGEIFGTIGGGALEHHVRKEAVLALQKQQSLLITSSLSQDLAMCCGGSVKIFIDVIKKKPRFFCFGAGHIAQALVPLLGNLELEIFLIDARKDLCQQNCFKSVRKKIHDLSVFTLKELPIEKSSFILIATHDHQIDQSVIESVITFDSLYFALVGSSRKFFMTKKRLLAKGFDESETKKIICPAGLNIGAQTPNEIALSIASQIVQVKNQYEKSLRSDHSSGQEHSHGNAKTFLPHQK